MESIFIGDKLDTGHDVHWETWKAFLLEIISSVRLKIEQI
jgi:hypothetical protein